MDNDAFAGRVRSAAASAWWVVLLASILLLVQWGVYLALMSTAPAWFQSIWGPGVSYSQIQSIWLPAMVTIKLGIFSGACVALWLTLWSRKLRQ
jgi:hypothetical protein